MDLDAALEVASGWLEDVPGVHVVEVGEDDSGNFVRIVVDGDIEPYLSVLPTTLFGVAVRFEQGRSGGGT